MPSPLSRRVLSPSKQLSSSPRGNTHGRNFSSADIICAGFLKYFKWLLAGIVGIAFVRQTTMDPFVLQTDDFYEQTDAMQAKTNIEARNVSATISNTRSMDTTINRIPTIVNPDLQTSKTEKTIGLSHASPGQITTNDPISYYKASNDPVILDGWNRTVQVHLVVDVTGSVDVDPASKLLLAGVERSEYTQLSAVTFVRPAIETFETFPYNSELPQLFLIDWGSMDRDCHRLELVLENLRLGKQQKEDPYFLLVDSSGSTRQTGCEFLFRGINHGDNADEAKSFTYGYTNDMNRIRLAKRSIVQNRYYDRTTRKMHIGELSPNQWDGTPPDYDRRVLQSPISLRESFVMGIQNITGGNPVAYKDSKRDVDVGFFWKSGDYSHYGFYRRDIAKVIKTLHHSALDKKNGKRMENTVGIAYSEEKSMESGHVQFRYIEQILACKIVVITQRDEWEDHYRLMESLASGALVMTDSMVALPDGLVDKVNILIYDSPKMLKDLIKYYLSPENKTERKRIASKGYKLVMGRHRSWHRLEELLFGRPLTNVDQPDAPAPKKEAPP